MVGVAVVVEVAVGVAVGVAVVVVVVVEVGVGVGVEVGFMTDHPRTPCPCCGHTYVPCECKGYKAFLARAVRAERALTKLYYAANWHLEETRTSQLTLAEEAVRAAMVTAKAALAEGEQ